MKRSIFVFGAAVVLTLSGFIGISYDKQVKNCTKCVASEIQVMGEEVANYWAFSDKNHKVKFHSGNIPIPTSKQVKAFHSKAELKSFTSAMVKKYKAQNKGDIKKMNLANKIEARSEYKAFFGRYNDKFFKNNSLTIAIIDKAPACADFSIKSLDVKDKTLVVKLNKKCPNPSGDKLNWVMVLETEKTDYSFQDVKVVV